VRARTITDEMCFAAAQTLADSACQDLCPDRLLPTMEDWEVYPRLAAAVGMKAQEQGLARKTMSYDELLNAAVDIIERSRGLTKRMMEEGFIPLPEDETEGASQ
jgi:malate dehydrogenase (oxaloacetate-decarboxylating)